MLFTEFSGVMIESASVQLYANFCEIQESSTNMTLAQVLHQFECNTLGIMLQVKTLSILPPKNFTGILSSLDLKILPTFSC